MRNLTVNIQRGRVLTANLKTGIKGDSGVASVVSPLAYNSLTKIISVAEGYAIPANSKAEEWNAKSNFSGSYADLTNKPAPYTDDLARTAVSSVGYLVAGDIANKADLVNGVVPASQLPSYVDDVLEYANLTLFPAIGENGKIYIDLQTNLVYRWTSSIYVEISKSLALGETSSTAYAGDKGKTAYDHSQLTGNPHNLTASDIGLGNIKNMTIAMAVAL